jgi:hypothetical protein
MSPVEKLIDVRSAYEAPTHTTVLMVSVDEKELGRRCMWQDPGFHVEEVRPHTGTFPRISDLGVEF